MFSSLRSKLAISHLLVVLCSTGILGIISFTLLTEHHKKETALLLEQSVISSSLQIKDYLDTKSFLLRTIINSNDVDYYTRKFQEAALADYFKQFESEFDSISYLLPTGQEEVRVENGDMAEEGRDFADNPLFTKAIASQERVFIGITRSEANPDGTIELVTALHNYFGAQPACLIRATISLTDLESHLAPITSDKPDQLILSDATQTIFLHPDPTFIGSPGPNLLYKSGNITKNALGVRGTYASVHMSNPSWQVIRVMSASADATVYRQFTHLIMMAAAIVSLLGLFISIFSARKIVAPLRQLTKALSEVASGEKTQEVDKYAIKELDSLADSFNEMLQRLTSTTITQQYLDNILNSLHEGLFVVNLDGTIESANQTILDLLAISEDDLIGQPVTRFFNNERLYAILRGEEQIDAGGLETTLVTTNQDSIPIQFFLSDLLDDDFERIGFVCLVLDIRHEKEIQTETDQLRYQLHQSQRLESVGTLASGIAHDFNNILTVITGFSQLIAGRVNNDPLCDNALKQVITASYRARDLVKQLLAFSRQEEHKKIVVTLNPIFNETLKMLRSSIPTYVDIEQTVAPQTYPVFADPSQIQQVLMNLCTNASQAIKGSGAISVSLNNVQVLEKLAPYQEIPKGEYVELVVSDNGAGIKEQDLENIFDPFFTTKDVDEGTGLGLAVVHGIVESLKGHILVQSKENMGTTFRILIPKSDGTEIIPPVTDDSSNNLLIGKGEHILFVDDERSLVDLMEKSLKIRGYEVTATTSPEKAYEIFKASPNDFQLAVTDFAMPKVKGDELINKLHKIKPELPVILCTGYHAKLLGMGDISGVNRVIKKPYTTNELIYNIIDTLQHTS